MNAVPRTDITGIIGKIPYRIALAGGWIDQPFVSRLDPEPPGSMVVIALEPTFHYMTRCGMATGTRDVARVLWGGALPEGAPADLVRTLYAAENAGKAEPSGSQDMIGLIYPGVNRLDFDYAHEGGIFPKHIESNNDPEIARWIERVIHVLPIAQRPEGYSPLGVKNLDPDWIRRLGRSGKDCYAAILDRNIAALGASMNECMACWAALLPHVVDHPALTVDLRAILAHYQTLYPGAMYSGCGGGYLYVVSDEPVPGAFKVHVRTAGEG
ncbi:MAG: hypothetical protein QG656_631 [Candidatus Hydrogenedentes bacterium]|nr:hypothetical protein [Candidatus Hydrogenedentota bacterium]